jgi:hypothetical protein
LTANTAYNFRLTATNASGDASSTTNATTKVAAPPTAPAGFTSTAQTSTSVTLSWTAQSDLTSYKLEYKKSSDSDWTVWTPAPGISADSATITGLTANTAYNFRLTAINATGEAFSTTNAATKVAAPANFYSVDQTNVSVALTWDSQSNLTSYKLEYKTASGNWTEWTPAPGISATNATITGLTANTTYEFRLTATSANGSEFSETTATTKSVAAPATPEDFRSTSQTATSITLAWTGATGLDGYKLRYSSDNGNTWTTYTKPIARNENGVTITGLERETPYLFQLAAINAGGTSDWAQANATTTVTTAPTDFTSTAQTSTSVTLSWTKPSKVTGYTLEYRKSTDSDWTTWTPAPAADATEITVTGLTANTAYNFRLTATNTVGAPASSTTNATTKVAALQGFHSTSATTNSVTLVWSKQSGVAGYKLEYSDDGGKNWKRQTVAADAETATVTGLTPATQYMFRLTATTTGGAESEPATTTARTIGIAPTEPTGFKVTSVTQDSVSLAWNTQSGVTEYKLQYRRNVDTNWTDAGTLPASQAAMTVNGLDPNMTYEFQITAINAEGQTTSRLSNVRTEGAKPAQPDRFSGTATTSSITLTWTKQSDLNGYTLEYRASSASTWTKYPGLISASATSVTLNGLKSATKYEFRLTAENNQGNSEPARLEGTDGVWTKYTAADIVPGTPYQPPHNVEAALKEGYAATTAIVTWEATPQANSKTAYVVQYREAGTSKWKSVTVKSSVTSGTLSKELKLASGKTYEIQVYVKGEKGGLSQSNAALFAGTVRTWAVLKAASLSTLKAAELAALGDFQSQSQIAMKVKNFAGNAVSSVPVNALTVTYKSQYSAATEVKFTLDNGVWTSDHGNVTFENGIIWIKDLELKTKYTVTAQFSNTVPGREAMAKSASKKSVSTTKANWTTPALNIQAAVAVSDVNVEWDAAKDDFNASAMSYTVKAYVFTGTKYKVAKKVTVKYGMTSAVLSNLKPGTYFLTVTANKDSLHEAGLEAAVTNASPSVTV